MTHIIISTDDMQPGVIPIWKQTWDKLKENHPLLKVTVFTIPLWKNISDNDVFRNKQFKQWYNERKTWVEVCQKGYNGLQPPECTRFKKPQYFMIKKAYRKIGSYMSKDYYSFKPSHSRMNKHTLSILRELGFSACIYNKNIIFIKKANSVVEDYVIINTHINMDEKYPDDIQTIHKKLNKYLFSLEEKGFNYSTIGELVKKSIEGEENAHIINC